MSWLFKSDWAASPRNPANADLDNIANDIKTWGGNVDAGGNSLVNCAAVYGLSGANPLMFWTNGAERARINSTGYLGIGTTTTPSPLTVGRLRWQRRPSGAFWRTCDGGRHAS